MNSQQTESDLESLAGMLDTALTSQDPRVVSALRQLMIMVALTRPDVVADKNALGPIRRLMSRVDDLHQRMERMEYELSRGRYEQEKKYKYDHDFQHQQYRNPWTDSIKANSEYRDFEMLKKLKGIL
jgi:hypothetical protein